MRLLTDTESEELNELRYRTLAWILTGKEDTELAQEIEQLPEDMTLVLLTLKYMVDVSCLLIKK